MQVTKQYPGGGQGTLPLYLPDLLGDYLERKTEEPGQTVREPRGRAWSLAAIKGHNVTERTEAAEASTGSHQTALRAEDRMGRERIESSDQHRFLRGDEARTGRFPPKSVPHPMEGFSHQCSQAAQVPCHQGICGI